ncbi:MAG: AI-2E family transporter [Cyclobacteriaceae bacterium]|nr:AI-2E family transporter [Cyclobacteriaceae bacterium]
MEVSKPFDRLDYIYKLFMIIALCILAMVFAADIVIPLLIAAFLSIVLLPVVKWFEKKLSLTFSVIVVLSISLVVFVGTMWIIGNQLTSLVSDLPNLESRYRVLVDDVSTQIQTTLGFTEDDQTGMIKDSLKSATVYVTNFLVSTTSTLSLIVQIPIYMFLFLIYRDRFRNFFLALLPHHEELKWKKEIDTVLKGYISGLLIVTLIVGTANTIGLLILGIDHAFFFGALSGILIIIPYVGIFIAALLPAVFALLTKDSAWYAVGVVAIFSTVQFLEGNFITPRITGSKVSINALAAIIALLIGGKILGIAGMILAVPITGVMRVLLAYSKHLKPFVILLEDTPQEQAPLAEEPVPQEEDKKVI